MLPAAKRGVRTAAETPRTSLLSSFPRKPKPASPSNCWAKDVGEQPPQPSPLSSRVIMGQRPTCRG
jgi:hypothetical protein